MMFLKVSLLLVILSILAVCSGRPFKRDGNLHHGGGHEDHSGVHEGHHGVHEDHHGGHDEHSYHDHGFVILPGNHLSHGSQHYPVHDKHPMPDYQPVDGYKVHGY